MDEIQKIEYYLYDIAMVWMVCTDVFGNTGALNTKKQSKHQKRFMITDNRDGKNSSIDRR